VNNKNENLRIDKNKFVFVNKEENFYRDEDSIAGESVSYLKDAYNRFKRNKASVVAGIILIVILFFTIFGPYMKSYSLIDTNPKAATYFKELPPKVPGLEHLGIFDGSKKLNSRDAEFIDMLPEGIVLKEYDRYMTQGKEFVDVKVDFYKYTEYIRAHRTGVGADRETVYRLTKSEYEYALKMNAVLELKEVNTSTGVYLARIDVFKAYMETDASSVYFWFGTDAIGKDLFTLIWEAARISISMAVAVTVINMIFGMIVGAIAGYYGGTTDIVIDRIVDVLSNIPFMAVLTILLLRFGNSLGVIIIAFTMTGWIGAYATTRMQFYRYKNREYVLAARSYGAKDRRIMYRHILPNALGTLITSFSLSIPSSIFTESTSSFLGIINYTAPTILVISSSVGQESMQNHYHLLLFPAIFISLFMLSFNMFANGLRDAFNPSLRGVE